MFKHDFRETLDGVVDIDEDPATLKHLLRYIYTEASPFQAEQGSAPGLAVDYPAPSALSRASAAAAAAQTAAPRWRQHLALTYYSDVRSNSCRARSYSWTTRWVTQGVAFMAGGQLQQRSYALLQCAVRWCACATGTAAALRHCP